MNKTKITGLLSLLTILIALAGCTQERNFLPTEESSSDGSTLTLTVTAPGEDPSLRAVMSQMEGSKDFNVRFKEGDKVLLFVSQDSKLYPLGEVPFATLSEDGKVGTINITLPEGVDKTKPIDLMGYNGFNQSNYKGEPNLVYYDKEHFDESLLDPELKGRPLVLMPASSFDGQRMEQFNAPVVFRLKGVTPSETSLVGLEADFQHIGAYEVVVLENRSKQDFRDPTFMTMPGSGKNKSYVLSQGFYNGRSENPFIDLMSGEVMILPRSPLYQESIYRTQALASGKTGVYISWVVPRPDMAQIPELALGAGTFSSIKTSEGLIPARKEPLKPGVAYIAYGYWDGTSLVALDREKEERKTQYVTVTTDIPAGQQIAVTAYLSYQARDIAYVDLNDNNVKDPGEAITKSFGEMLYTVSGPRISFRGAFEDLQLSKQQLTDVEISPVAALCDLDVRHNKLSAAALNKIIDQLPDRNGVEPNDVNHMLLQISGNPGLEEKGTEVNLKKALDKGWSVDVPIVRDDLPQNYMELRGNPPYTLGFAVEAEPAERDKVWIDLNGNGTMEEGEKINNFGSTRANVVNPQTPNLCIYGHIISLTISYGDVSAYFGTAKLLKTANKDLKHLNLSGTGVTMCLSGLFPKLETLLLADNPSLMIIDDEDKGFPFLQNPSLLKVLDLGNSGSVLRGMNVKIDVPQFHLMTGLTYLNIQGWGWTSEQVDLSMMTKLERLVASGNNLSTIDLSGAKEVKYIELIGNKLTKEALNKLIADLPDRTGKSPGQLFIAENPGSGAGKYSIAKSKNWRVDARNSISDHPARRPNMEGEDW